MTFLAVMLGTNDILNSFQPDAAEAGRNMEAFLLHALNHPQIQGEGQKLFARSFLRRFQNNNRGRIPSRNYVGEAGLSGSIPAARRFF